MPINVPPSQSVDPYSIGISSGVDNLFEAYFAAPRTGKTNPLAGRNVSIFNGDEAYEGQALQLPPTLMDWMWTANQTFYTEVVLPWKVVEDIYVEWVVWEANAHVMPQNPHQGVARNVTQRRSAHRAALIRRGLGMQFEHDWARTKIGRESILIGLGQIVRSRQETANVEVIRSLLHASHWYQQWVRENGQVRRLDHLEYLKQNRDYFAYFQKEKNAPALWDSHSDAEAWAYHGRFDTIILPERMLNYVGKVRPEHTDYYMKGPKAPDNVDGTFRVALDPALMQDSAIPRVFLNGKSVYPARAFHVDGTEPLNLLAKPVQIGEYNWMTDEHCQYSDGYDSSERDIMIYDEDRDRFAKFTLREALKYCGIFDTEGNLLGSVPAEMNDMQQSVEDMRRDFLSRDTSVKPEKVRMFGEIADIFYGATMWEKMGKTFEQKIKIDGKATADDSAIKALLLKIFPSASFAKNVLQQEDNVFNVLEGNAYAIIKSRVDQSGGGLIWNNYATAVHAMMQGVVSEPRDKQEVKRIFDSAQSKQDLGQRLRTLLSSASVGEGMQFSSEAEFRRWFNPRLDQRILNTNELTFKERSNEIRHVPVGSELPEGWDWVNPQDATKPVGDNFPSSFEELMRRIPPSSSTQRNTSTTAIDDEYEEDGYGGIGFHSNVGALGDFGANNEGLRRKQNIYNAEPGYVVNTGNQGLEGEMNMFSQNLATIANSNLSKAGKMGCAAFLLSDVNRKNLESIIANNILFPFNMILFRPHATFRGNTVIKCMGGGVAGNTYFSMGSAETGHDVARMVGELHTVCYMAAIVHKPQYVYCTPNMYVDRYLGGLGMKVYTPESYQNRSTQGNELSIIVAAIPYTERSQDLPNPLDIAGRFYTDFESGLVDARGNEELHYSTAFRYNNRYLFYTRSNAMDENNYPTVLPEDNHLNRICWAGAQYMFNRKTGRWDYYEANTSGWGDLVYAGCGRVRDGADQYLDPARMQGLVING
jgi:hypothetical protein